MSTLDSQTLVAQKAGVHVTNCHHNGTISPTNRTAPGFCCYPASGHAVAIAERAKEGGLAKDEPNTSQNHHEIWDVWPEQKDFSGYEPR